MDKDAFKLGAYYGKSIVPEDATDTDRNATYPLTTDELPDIL